MPTQLNRKVCIVWAICFVALSFCSNINFAVRAESTSATSSFGAMIEVNEVGDATVLLNFTSRGSGEFSTYLPVNATYEMREIGGHFGIVKAEIAGVFYNKTYFDYDLEETSSLIIEYNFSHAALYSGSSAWYMSPMLGNDVANTSVSVHFANFIEVVESDPADRYVEGTNVMFVLPSSDFGQRIAINYKLARPLQQMNFTQEINDMQITVQSDAIYGDIAESIFKTFTQAYDNLTFLFGGVVPEVHFQFYLPNKMDFGALGYMTEEDVQIGGGPININLVLIRFQHGYFEQVILHEYTHLALGRAGIGANDKLRWFHEGMAEYVSDTICTYLGIQTDVKNRLATYENYVKNYGNDLSFVQNWDYDPEVADLYYAVSYFMIERLGAEYGDFNFYRMTLARIRQMGGASNLENIVTAMSLATDKDLSSVFRGWGFDVQITGAIPFLLYGMLLIMVLMGATIIALDRLFSRKIALPAPP